MARSNVLTVAERRTTPNNDAVTESVTSPILPVENSTGQKLCTALYITASSTYATSSFSINVPYTSQQSDCHRENESGNDKKLLELSRRITKLQSSMHIGVGDDDQN